MVTVAVTGSIGSGKSQVCRYLASKGFEVYNCDARAKALYLEIPGLLDRVEEAVGAALRLPDGSLDKESLARVIFADREKLLAVEALVHPEVYRDFERWRSSCDGAVVFMESAIFLQKPLFHPLADFVVSVTAPPEQIVRRIMARDRVDRETAERRFLSQDTFASRLPDMTLVNDGTLERLEGQVDEMIKTINNKFFNDMDKTQKTDLAKILTVSGQHGLFEYIAQAKNGIIVESLADGQRTALSNRSRVNTLADISIYTSEGEMKLQEVFTAIKDTLAGADAPGSKASAETLKDLFARAVPNYDADRFYVSHMKKVVDWYGELVKYASLDFVTDEERQAQAEAE